MTVQRSLLAPVSRALAQLPRWQIATLCLVLQLAIGLVDYVTGPDVVMSPFYLIPVCIATWYLGRRQGTINVLLSVIIAMSANGGSPEYVGRSYLLVWNFATRLALYFGVQTALTALRDARRAARTSGGTRRISAPRSSGEAVTHPLEG